jgi:fructosamine-3-kinase
VSGAGKVFVKAATPHARLEAELDGLCALRDTRAVRVPAALGLDASGLALEWLDLRPLDTHAAAALGRALAALHGAPVAWSGGFGWRCDNYIGATPQPNAACASWTAFFREQRLAPQLARAARNGYGSALQVPGARLLDVLDTLLAGHDPRPSLLHGDLWGGNAGALPDGTPVIFDPAVYVGDREADLAMTELFGGFPASFHAAYREAWPLEDGYAQRRELYNLYHLLNHLNLFGAGYLQRCERTLSRLLATLA